MSESPLLRRIAAARDKAVRYLKTDGKDTAREIKNNLKAWWKNMPTSSKLSVGFVAFCIVTGALIGISS